MKQKQQKRVRQVIKMKNAIMKHANAIVKTIKPAKKNIAGS